MVIKLLQEMPLLVRKRLMDSTTTGSFLPADGKVAQPPVQGIQLAHDVRTAHGWSETPIPGIGKGQPVADGKRCILLYGPRCRIRASHFPTGPRTCPDTSDRRSRFFEILASPEFGHAMAFIPDRLNQRLRLIGQFEAQAAKGWLKSE